MSKFNLKKLIEKMFDYPFEHYLIVLCLFISVMLLTTVLIRGVIINS